MRSASLQREQLLSLQKRQEELCLSPEAKQRLEWLVYFVEHGRSVSKTCHYFAIARTTLQRWLVRFDPDNPFCLEERSHRALKTKKPCMSLQQLQTVAHYRRWYPYADKKQLLQILAREQGIWMSVQELDRALVQIDSGEAAGTGPLPVLHERPADTQAFIFSGEASASVSENRQGNVIPATRALSAFHHVLRRTGVALSLVAISWLLASHQLSTFAYDIQTQVGEIFSITSNDTSSFHQ